MEMNVNMNVRKWLIDNPLRQGMMTMGRQAEKETFLDRGNRFNGPNRLTALWFLIVAHKQFDIDGIS